MVRVRHTLRWLPLALPCLLLLLLAVCTSTSTSAADSSSNSNSGRARSQIRDGVVSSETALRRLLTGLSRDQKEALRRETHMANQEMAARTAAAAAAAAGRSPRSSSSASNGGGSAGPDFSVIPSFVRGLMACRGVSGVSVGIVQNGEIVYTAGFGVQSTGGAPVDADTLFGIGSCTKAFTASLGAILQQDGKFDLNRPVVDYVPEYRLIDSAVSGMVSATDLLAHRTGLASHDTALFLNTDNNRREKIMNARALTPQNPFRASFIYNNCATHTGTQTGTVVVVDAQRSFRPTGQSFFF